MNILRVEPLVAKLLRLNLFCPVRAVQVGLQCCKLTLLHPPTLFVTSTFLSGITKRLEMQFSVVASFYE